LRMFFDAPGGFKAVDTRQLPIHYYQFKGVLFRD
jgi:hypothetical protein